VRLKNKVAVVTGTSPNIGGGIAEALAEEGAAVACIDANEANARGAASYIVGSGGRAIGLACDVTDEEQVRRAVQATREQLGEIGILVNNAAIFNKKGVLDMSLEDWRRQIDIILTGSFLFTKYCAQAMIDAGKGGAIINIISTAGHQGEPGNIAYSTAKCGLLNFTRSAAMELSQKGIRVNSLTPTATDPTEAPERSERWGIKTALPAGIVEAFEPFRRGVPMQRLPKPSDYGKAAAFLASDDAAMITGVDLRVDAGAVSRYWAWDPSKGA